MGNLTLKRSARYRRLFGLERLLSVAALASLLASATASAAPTTSAVAEYAVRYSGGDEFHVDARFAAPTSKLTLYSFPNAQNAIGQAAFIQSLRLWDDQGKEQAAKFDGEGNWTGANGPIGRAQYRVLARHDRQSWGPGKDEVATRFDNSFFFAGNAFFLADYGWPEGPVRVHFDLPKGWKAITPWSGSGADFEAARRRNLTFNSFAISKDPVHVEQAGPIRLTWMAENKLAPVEPQLRELLVRLPAVYADFWGNSPIDAFTVFAFSDPETDGGAFVDSFALRLSTPFEKIDRVAWPHWLGHELMHLWNGAGRIRVAEDGSTYWFNEGVTDYLTVKLMYQAGLIDDATLKQRLANFVRRYQFGRKLSPGVKFAAAGADKFKNWEVIYGGGALFGLLVDAELSKSDSDSFRRMLRQVYAQADQPYDQQRLMSVLNANSNGKAGAIVAWLDQGQGWPQLRERFRSLDIEFSGFGSDEAYLDFACAEPGCVPPYMQKTKDSK